MGLQHWKRRELPQERAEKDALQKKAFAAQVKIGLARQKPGPKPSGNAKQLLTLRLDQDVVAKFRATGPGWQARMNDVLKAAKV